VNEAERGVGQSQGLLHTDYGLRLQDSKFITYGKIDVKLGSFLANWNFLI
jgi:hypothetical protein